jgi:hypothetical protein
VRLRNPAAITGSSVSGNTILIGVYTDEGVYLVNILIKYSVDGVNLVSKLLVLEQPAGRAEGGLPDFHSISAW